MAKRKGSGSLFKVYGAPGGAAGYRLDRKFTARLQRARAELLVCSRVFGDRTTAGGKASQAAAVIGLFLRSAGLGVSPIDGEQAPVDGKALAAGEGRPG